MSTPSIERNVPGEDGREGLIVRSPYDASLVEELKSQLPRGDRYWTGDAWWCALEHEEVVVHLLHQRWPEILFYGQDGESDYLMDRKGTVIEQGRLL